MVYSQADLADMAGVKQPNLRTTKRTKDALEAIGPPVVQWGIHTYTEEQAREWCRLLGVRWRG